MTDGPKLRKAKAIGPRKCERPLTEQERRETDRLLASAGVCLACHGAGCPSCPVVVRRRRVPR